MTALSRYLARLRQRQPIGPITEDDVVRLEKLADIFCIISGVSFSTLVLIVLLS